MVSNLWIKIAVVLVGIITITLLRLYFPTSESASVVEKVVDEVVVKETGIDVDPKDPPPPISV